MVCTPRSFAAKLNNKYVKSAVYLCIAGWSAMSMAYEVSATFNPAEEVAVRALLGLLAAEGVYVTHEYLNRLRKQVLGILFGAHSVALSADAQSVSVKIVAPALMVLLVSTLVGAGFELEHIVKNKDRNLMFALLPHSLYITAEHLAKLCTLYSRGMAPAPLSLGPSGVAGGLLCANSVGTQFTGCNSDDNVPSPMVITPPSSPFVG